MLEALKLIIPALTTIVGSYLAYRLGVRRQSAVLLEKEVAKDETAVEGWQSLAARYARDFDTMREQMEALSIQVEALQTKVHELERERDLHQFWRRVGVAYINTLLAVLAENGVPVPPAPPGLNLDPGP